MVTILIVEDDEAISNLICTTLQGEGYLCTCARDGKTGADLIDGGHWDLVLLDLMLPEISGYDLLEYLRPTETPVIIISAMGQVQDRIRGLKMGADDYLVKPFQIGELVARVESVLRRTAPAPPRPPGASPPRRPGPRSSGRRPERWTATFSGCAKSWTGMTPSRPCSASVTGCAPPRSALEDPWVE